MSRACPGAGSVPYHKGQSARWGASSLSGHLPFGVDLISQGVPFWYTSRYCEPLHGVYASLIERLCQGLAAFGVANLSICSFDKSAMHFVWSPSKKNQVLKKHHVMFAQSDSSRWTQNKVDC